MVGEQSDDKMDLDAILESEDRFEDESFTIEDIRKAERLVITDVNQQENELKLKADEAKRLKLEEDQDDSALGSIRKWLANFIFTMQMFPEESEYTICACFAFITITYFFFVFQLGKYAHANPDPAHCMYIEGLETTAVTEMTARS